jgi:hypothetical protein
MASNTTNPRPGRAGRVIHWFFPSRRQLAVSLAAEIGLASLGLPLWSHFILGLVIHLAVAVLD